MPPPPIWPHHTGLPMEGQLLLHRCGSRIRIETVGGRPHPAALPLRWLLAPTSCLARASCRRHERRRRTLRRTSLPPPPRVSGCIAIVGSIASAGATLRPLAQARAPLVAVLKRGRVVLGGIIGAKRLCERAGEPTLQVTIAACGAERHGHGVVLLSAG